MRFVSRRAIPGYSPTEHPFFAFDDKYDFSNSPQLKLFLRLMIYTGTRRERQPE